MQTLGGEKKKKEGEELKAAQTLFHFSCGRSGGYPEKEKIGGEKRTKSRVVMDGTGTTKAALIRDEKKGAKEWKKESVGV